MSDFSLWPYKSVAQRVNRWCYRANDRTRRLHRAWSYFTDRLSADDARAVMLDCERPAGWHPLLILTVDEALEQAHETFADHSDLRRLIADGCARVGHKWESYNDDLYNARSWAIDVAEQYARDEGIALVRLDKGDAPPRAEDVDGAVEGGAP
jgi:hypothetical protein